VSGGYGYPAYIRAEYPHADCPCLRYKVCDEACELCDGSGVVLESQAHERCRRCRAQDGDE
jgi:hypothetical protein